MPSTTHELAGIVRSALIRAKAQSRPPWKITSSIPTVSVLNALIDVLYYTSLKTEEGRPVTARLCLVNPKRPDDSPPPRPRASRWTIAALSDPLPLTVPNLVKLSKAADPWSSALAVHYDESGNLFIWGLIDQTVHWSRMLVREGTGYAPPGLVNLVTTGVADISAYRSWGFIARLQQDRIIDSQNDVFWSGPVAGRLREWVSPFLDAVKKKVTPEIYGHEPFWDSTFYELWVSVLCRILISIQRFHHGGALLISAEHSDLVARYKLRYNRLPNHLFKLALEQIKSREAGSRINEITEDLENDVIPISDYLEQRIADSDEQDLEESITGTVQFISSLSCVDGLVLMTPDLTVCGYGVEIRTPKELEQIRVSLAPVPVKTKSILMDPNHFGTRHRSMMRYCHAHPKSLGFVISQDGDIRAMMRVKEDLVMWENLKVHLLWNDDAPKQFARSKKSKK